MIFFTSVTDAFRVSTWTVKAIALQQHSQVDFHLHHCKALTNAGSRPPRERNVSHVRAVSLTFWGKAFRVKSKRVGIEVGAAMDRPGSDKDKAAFGQFMILQGDWGDRLAGNQGRNRQHPHRFLRDLLQIGQGV